MTLPRQKMQKIMKTRWKLATRVSPKILCWNENIHNANHVPCVFLKFWVSHQKMLMHFVPNVFAWFSWARYFHRACEQFGYAWRKCCVAVRRGAASSENNSPQAWVRKSLLLLPHQKCMSANGSAVFPLCSFFFVFSRATLYAFAVLRGHQNARKCIKCQRKIKTHSPGPNGGS